MSKKLAIIDGKSVFYRGFYAMGNLKTSDGTPVGGVYGFMAMALELLNKYEPDYVCVAWDKAKTNIRRRRNIYPEYKANRKAAPPEFYEQVPILKNLLDALSWPLYEYDDFEADDIIGTLSRQADNLGNIETLMITSDLDMLQVVDHNTKLYALKRGFTQIDEFDVAALEKKYGISKDQFLDLKALKGDSSDNIPGVPGIGEKTAVALLQEYKNLDNIFAHLDEIKPLWAKKLQAGRELAYISKELGEINFNAPVKLDLASMDVRNCDTEKILKTMKKLEFNSLIKRLPDFMKPTNLQLNFSEKEDVPGIFFKNTDNKIIVNDAKVLAKKMLAKNQPLPEVEFDTRIAGFLLGRITKVSNESELKSLYEKQKSKLEKIPKLNKIARELDFPMQTLLAKMENRGVKIDVDGLMKLSTEVGEKITKIEENIFDQAGERFNIASPQQLSTVLFEKLKLPTTGIKRTKKAYSTGQKELQKLKNHHPIINDIIEYRELSKMQNTYITTLPKLVDKNSYLHSSFHQDVTATGRLSSSEPNLQNIPVRSELGKKIREYFIASEGKILVSADYSQFELRLAAALSGDKNMIKMFNDDRVDIHTQTAAEAYGVSVDRVTPTMRRNAKVINFGVLYGMSPHGLSEVTDMTVAEAKEFIDRYFTLRKPIRDFLQSTIEKAKSNGYVETLFGRRRTIPDINSSVYMVRESAKRAAANMPIQGTEADLMKLAMLKIDRELGEIAPQILQIHDSIMVECNPQDLERVSQKMRDIMENIYPEIGVKLKVDIKSGKNWGAL